MSHVRQRERTSPSQALKKWRTKQRGAQPTDNRKSGVALRMGFESRPPQNLLLALDSAERPPRSCGQRVAPTSSPTGASSLIAGSVGSLQLWEHREVADVRGEQFRVEEKSGGGDQVVDIVYAAVRSTVTSGESSGGSGHLLGHRDP